jgi:glucose-6-phosphate 1-dehydrogenase
MLLIQSKEHPETKNHLENLDSTLETGSNAIYYLSTPPALYGVIPTLLGEVGLNTSANGSWKKLIVEKPFGYDLASALELNKKLSKYFKEEQIYRIDHYLGKESVQNILVTRFSNGVFEPLWNKTCSSSEITVENIGIKIVADIMIVRCNKDMVQNHLLQLTG